MPLPLHKAAISEPAYPVLRHYISNAKFSWVSELRHLFSHKFLNIFWWPLFQFHQRRFTQSALFKSCKKLPGFSDLWKTIQKGSFAYNTLFLSIPGYKHCTNANLADITTLTLFFGDEFIDGIAAATGKPFITQLISNNPGRFYLKRKTNAGKVKLQYHVDLAKLLPEHVLQEVNPKYQISYLRFYDLLQQFLQLINKHLGYLPVSKSEKVADKIADACNTCFESFLHDMNSCPVKKSIPAIQEILHFHELKTAFMQKKLLELRCILADNEDAMNTTQATGWLDIMRVIQIYDDIHDVIIDDGFQDNLVLSIAYHYFPNEWEWFCDHKNLVEQEKQQILLLFLYMPCSMEYCLQLASDKIKIMNWEQQKIMHYLLFKNKYVLYVEKDSRVLADKNDFLLQFYKQVKSKMPHLSLQAIKSYTINTCIHVKQTRRSLLKKLRFSKRYQLRYDLLSVSVETKAEIFDTATAIGII